MKDYLRLFAGIPLEFTPGARHQYGNSGYVLLGALIETITGTSFYAHVQQSIFEPAGMLDTAFDELDLPAANRAEGYTTQSWFSPVRIISGSSSPAGRTAPPIVW